MTTVIINGVTIVRYADAIINGNTYAVQTGPGADCACCNFKYYCEYINHNGSQYGDDDNSPCSYVCPTCYIAGWREVPCGTVVPNMLEGTEANYVNTTKPKSTSTARVH